MAKYIFLLYSYGVNIICIQNGLGMKTKKIILLRNKTIKMHYNMKNDLSI